MGTDQKLSIDDLYFWDSIITSKLQRQLALSNPSVDQILRHAPILLRVLKTSGRLCPYSFHRFLP